MAITIKNHVGTSYASPAHLNINWCYGSALIVSLLVQIVSGLVLATFYTPRNGAAFKQVLTIASTAVYGAERRYLHRTNVSIIFIFLYRHLFRGRYYGCYVKNSKAWLSGLTRFVLIIATAFTGYVLPWGQRSLWGAIVITNLFTVVPGVGIKIVQWFWGGRTVSDITLYRFYVLHFILPFIILIGTFFHLYAVHEKGSSDPLGLAKDCQVYQVGLAPNYIIKDLRVITFAYLALFLYTAVKPDLFVHCVNYAKADNLSTPAHIVPEWYLLPFYGRLRSIENKTLGRLTRAAAFVILFRRPYRGRNTYIASARFNFLKQTILWRWVSCFFNLGYLGACEPIDTVTTWGQIYTACYFILIFRIFILDYFEKAYDDNKIFAKWEKEELKREKIRNERRLAYRRKYKIWKKNKTDSTSKTLRV